MKVKITKNSKPLSWYSDRIGETFEVIEHDTKNHCFIVHRGRVLDSYIVERDCEIIGDIPYELGKRNRAVP